MPSGTRAVRLSWTILLAAALATLGVLRLLSDILTDIDPTWVAGLGESPLRLLVRTTDGSLVGNLNTQYFKVMAIPCGLAAAERRWASSRLRLRSIVARAAVRAFCEVEKATHCHIFERYVDSAAVLTHPGTFGERFAGRFLEILKPVRFVVDGSPDPAAQDASAGVNSVYMQSVFGFSR